jgi:hypothetical protein
MVDGDDITALGELVATVPAMLGFRPTDSLVLIIGSDHSDAIALVRADLDVLDEPVQAVVTVLTTRLRRSVTGAERAVVLLVGDGGDSAVPPDSDKINALVTALARNAIEVTAALWAPSIGVGIRWEGLGPSTPYSGIQPDWTSSAAAVDAVVDGYRIFDSREEIDQLLAPVDATTLQRRHTALREWETNPDKARMTSSTGLKLVLDAVDRAENHVLPSGDDEFVTLAWALGFSEVHAIMALPPADRDRRAAPANLWATMARNLPGIYGAQAACLFAAYTHSLGQRVVANTALQRAHAAAPGHPLVHLFNELLTSEQLPDEVVHRMGNDVTSVVLARIQARGDFDGALPQIRRDAHGRCLGVERP